MKDRAGWPLSALLAVVFLVLGLVATVLVRQTLDQRQQQVVGELGLQESRKAAAQIYEHLYSVMRKGWDRAELEATLARIAHAHSDVEIRLIRAQGVADQYGDDNRAAAARADDPAVRLSLASGELFHAEQDGQLRYIMPMVNAPECLACHANPPGSINGLIDLRMRAEELRAPIEATLSPLLNLVTILIGAIFVVMFLWLRVHIVLPITRLSLHVGEMSDKIDESSPIVASRAWPREIQSLARQFNRLADEVRESHHRLTELAVRDKLTGLYNRRYFDEMLARTIDQAARKKQPMSLLMLDLDGFKAINDLCGHAMGDTVLVDVGAVIQQLSRDGDICSRIGGDEFLIIAIDCNVDNARLLAERLVEHITGLSWSCADQVIQIGVSIGVAAYPEQASDFSTLLSLADEQMYHNKRARRQTN